MNVNNDKESFGDNNELEYLNNFQKINIKKNKKILLMKKEQFF